MVAVDWVLGVRAAWILLGTWFYFGLLDLLSPLYPEICSL